MNVVDKEVQDRAGPPIGAVLAVKVKACAIGVEEGEVAEGEDMWKAKTSP